MSRHAAHSALGSVSALIASVLLAGLVQGHVVKQAGPYTLEIGWQHEPTYVGESNGVQIIVHDAAEKPVTDLKEDDVKVVVSTGGQQSGELTFAPGFDLEEMEGRLGEYDAPIVPTAPGDYTFHVTGAIHGTAIDITVTSGDETFDAVKDSSDLQFPTKLPTLTEMVTRLDRIDTRLSSGTGPTQADFKAAKQSATEAHQAADRALWVGGGIGLAGLIVGGWSLLVAKRAQLTARG